MRPEDIHVAMRADLVLILKDVVGLIARIEASIPEPSEHRGGPHKPAPAAERPMKAGSDAKAAHSCVVGAAPAVKDERPPQPIPDQPTDAALSLRVETAEPPAVVLPRPPQEAPKAILIPKAGAEAKPRTKSKPLDPRPGRAIGVVITHKGSVVDVDVINHVVRCPKGDWRTSAPVASIMERMRNGETFGDNVLAEIGSMGEESFRESRKRWGEELGKRGIAFIHTKGVGSRIEVAQ